MRTSRLAPLVLGMWFGAGLLMLWMTGQPLRSVNEVLMRPNPAATLQLRSATGAQTLALVRYFASEEARDSLETWGMVQLAVGAFFFLFLLFGTNQGKVSLALALVMFLISAGQRLGITPELVARGRSLDFLTTITARQQTQVEVLRYAYHLSELVKWGLGAVLAMALCWRSRRSLDSGNQVHMVNKTDHRHINR